MAEYGLTANGINIKRLDVIIDEIHADLTRDWGINTRTNPKSFLNVLITDFGDKIAELWEFGSDVYYSQNPLTATGMFLDGAGQFAGISREDAKPSYYRILCTGVEGTEIPADTIITSDTNPAVNLRSISTAAISRKNFSTAILKVVSLDGNPLTVSLNGNLYSVTPESGDTVSEALAALAEQITDESFTVNVPVDSNVLTIEAVSKSSTNTMILSDNLTTTSVGTVVTFATEDYGDIYLPEGSITIITKSVTGLKTVTNVGEYIAGQLEEDDETFRRSYMEKIFYHSSRMTQSIRSAIINNCQGVKSVTVYENVGNTVDSAGRYPHSVEVVVDGGDEAEIAQQIFDVKAGGINTYGSVNIPVTGDNEEEIIIRFNRPSYVTAWFKIELTLAPNTTTLPEGYADVVREQVLEALEGLECGEDVIVQNTIIPKIYENLDGIDFVSVTIATGTESPESYPLNNLYVSERERAVARTDTITVTIND